MAMRQDQFLDHTGATLAFAPSSANAAFDA